MKFSMIRDLIFQKRTGIRLTILWLVFTLISCHTEKKLERASVGPSKEPSASVTGSSNLSSDFILEKLHGNIIPYKTFSAHAKLDITTPTGSQSGIATFIRMQKDSIIWISVRPVLGIELVRIMITPDSLKMINFFKKTLTLRGTSSFQRLFHIPFDFDALQNMIIGNAPLLADSLDQIRHDSTQNSISFACKKGDLISRYIVDTGSFLLQKNILEQTDSTGDSRSSEETFSEYVPLNEHEFSGKRHLLIQAGTQTTADIRFSHVEINKDISFPFPEVSNFRKD